MDVIEKPDVSVDCVNALFDPTAKGMNNRYPEWGSAIAFEHLKVILNPNVQSRKKRYLKWFSILPECKIGEFRIVPLTNSRLLRAEGRAMGFCVGHYDVLCEELLTRAFSIRDWSGKRVATVSLIWDDRPWCLEQIKGQGYTDVLEDEKTFFDGNSTATQTEPTELYYVAHEIARLHLSAWNKLVAEARMRNEDV